MNTQHVLIIASLLCLALVPATPGEIKMGKSVYRMSQIDAAKEEAKSKNEAITFLYTDENTKCGLCEAASMDVINGMKAKSTIVYVNSNNEGGLLPQLVQEALKKPEAGQFIPKTVVVDPDITQVIAIVPYDSEQARKSSITKAKKLISKALPDKPPAAASPAAATVGVQDKEVHGPRTWTSVSGTKLEAAFEGSSLDMVSLRKTDGTLMSIHISKLSAEDQSLVRQWSSSAP
jgi:hypothetical protein